MANGSHETLPSSRNGPWLPWRARRGYRLGSVNFSARMKTVCDECNGRGMIECPECDGKGEWNDSIETIELHRSMRNYEELVELQRDAKRVIKQAQRLKELNPRRSGVYAEQLEGCLEVINQQAEKTAGKKLKHL